MTNQINNGRDGAYGSGGSMCNPMYKQIHTEGLYVPASGRCKKRLIQKAKGICLSKKSQFWDL